MKKNINFLIVTPRQSCGGGPIVLYKLCALLSEKGYKAEVYDLHLYRKSKNIFYNFFSIIKKVCVDYIKYYSLLAKLFLPHKCERWRYKSVLNVKEKIFPIYDKSSTIVVYPEIVFENPLKAKFVVRWLLSYDKFSGEKFYDDSDLFFLYRKQFKSTYTINKERMLSIHDFNSRLYRKYNFGERKGTCYIIRKGKERNDLPSAYEGIIIDGLPEKEKVKVFNECAKCISYDMQTFYTTIAALCGCEVECVLEPGKTKSDYLKKDDVVYGVAYGNSKKEKEYAMKTQSRIYEVLNDFDVQNSKNVDFFISECKNYFGFN